MPQPATSRTRRWLTLARLVWVWLALSYLSLWLASLPGYYERVSTLSITPFKLGERVVYDNALAKAEATQRGISIETNAVYNIAYGIIQVLVFYGVAGLILWRASNGFGWFTALVLMLFSTTIMQQAIGVAPTFPGALFLIEIPAYIVWPLWVLWLALFPNGHLHPKQAVIPFSVAIILFLVGQVLGFLSALNFLSAQIDSYSATILGPLVILPVFAFVLFSQIYRYRHVFTFIERQQTKWFLFGLGLFFLGIVLVVVSPTIYQIPLFDKNIFSVLFLLFPIVVAIAILRYQLFDIDVVIRRTLQYSLLSGLLALVYFGLIIVLQSVFRAITGQSDNPIITVLSTLAIAALFFPLRKRVQNFIDKRFFRKKYDAAKTLAAFAATARDETDLDKLTARLIEVVDETMQPESVSLWLKPTPGQDGNQTYESHT